jgi:hypothetical protein
MQEDNIDHGVDSSVLYPPIDCLTSNDYETGKCSIDRQVKLYSILSSSVPKERTNMELVSVT